MSHIAFGEKKGLDDVWPFKQRRFLLRTDFECLMENGAQQPIHPLLSTILKIVQRGGRLIIACSFGAIKNPVEIKLTPAARQSAIEGFPPQFSAQPLVEMLRHLLPAGTQVAFAPDCLAAGELVKSTRPGDVLVLQNLRMYKAELSERAEERLEMARILETYVDVFVNDVFATLHLVAAATVELPRLLKHGVCGELMAQELSYFSRVLTHPRRPLALIIGSVHLQEKMTLLESLIRKVDKVLISAAMALPFLMARGISVGRLSPEICDEAGRIRWSDVPQGSNPVEFAKKIMRLAERYNVKLILPDDFICHTSIEPTRFPTVTPTNRVPSDLYVVDIGPRTTQRFTAEIRDSRTLFWTGRMGCARRSDYTNGTTAIAMAVAHSSCVKVVGGKNTVNAVRTAGVEDAIDHMTTGPNSMLRVLEGTPLEALNVLSDAYPPVAADLHVSVQQLLRSCVLFRCLTVSQLRPIIGKAVPRRHAMGDVLVHEGDRITSMFVVARGFLNAAPKSQQGKSIASRIIGVGESFGEFSFLGGKCSTSVLQAGTDDTLTFQLTSAALEEAFGESPDLAYQIMRGTIEILRAQHIKDTQERWSEWYVLRRSLRAARKPNPWGNSGGLADVAAAVVPAIVLHPLTLQYTPFSLQTHSCMLSRIGHGVVLLALHHTLREVLFQHLTATSAGTFMSTGLVTVLSTVAVTPLRIASTGVPLASTLSLDRFLRCALASAALSAAPAAAHALFLFRKSAIESTAWHQRRTVTWLEEVLSALGCRAVVALLCLPLVAHRNGAIKLTPIGAAAYVIRQLLALLIESIVIRLCSRRCPRLSAPKSEDPQTPLSLMQQGRATGYTSLW